MYIRSCNILQLGEAFLKKENIDEYCKYEIGEILCPHSHYQFTMFVHAYVEYILWNIIYNVLIHKAFAYAYEHGHLLTGASDRE